MFKLTLNLIVSNKQGFGGYRFIGSKREITT